MKVNQPLTNCEVKLKPDQELVSITDLKGIITYANPAFIEISGFGHDELIGKNHNLVRHPDMPPAAFKHLWDTIQLGRPWSNLVKNRCKNGDFYWVKANVTPVTRDGEIVEYMSVRTKPEQSEIEQAESLYERLNRGEVSLPSPKAITDNNLSDRLRGYALSGVAAALVINTVLYFINTPTPALVAGPIVAFFIMLMGARKCCADEVTKSLAVTQRSIQALTEGDYHSPIVIDDPGEIGELKRVMKKVALSLGFEVNNAKDTAARAERIKFALDNVSSNVMLADNNGDIIYCNDAVLSMMRRAETDIQQALPSFSVDTLIGSNIDQFHKDPSHQRKMLASLNATFKGRIHVAERCFDLIANPVIDASGERLGTVVQWLDVTEQLLAEQQIEQLIMKASTGELDQRLDTDDYSGFMKDVAIGINQLLGSITHPLGEVKRVLTALADGDLTQSMEGDYLGEFAELNRALQTSVSSLNTIVAQIRSAGSSISTGATEISAGNMTLSNRTESQAASLEETAASMEEMTSTVKLNADNSEQARQLASAAEALATKGTEVSHNVTTSMSEISASSRKISEIIGVIDEIAFQTNLLALNAAVEAARAGEQGRGFAVVASEVRNLAQRSASAAKEIKELISDSVKKVEEGSLFVDESGKALGDIMGSIKDVSELVHEIAAASREQAIGIEQVNIAVTQMDEGVQQNAALVEQVAAASGTMDEEASELKSLVSQFQVSGGDEAQSTSENGVQRIRELAAETASVPVTSPQSSRTSPHKNVIVGANASEDVWGEF